jgi:hypothetical protein
VLLVDLAVVFAVADAGVEACPEAGVAALAGLAVGLVVDAAGRAKEATFWAGA